MSRGKSIALGFLIVIVAFVIIGSLFALKPKPPKKPPQSTSPLVEVIVPQAEPVQFAVTAHGVVQPRTETTLVSEVSGVVQKVSEGFVSGGYFREGDVLLQIDPTDYEVAVEQAKARLAGEQAKYAQEQAKAEQARKEWDLTGRSRDKAPILALREPFLLEAKANVLSAEADLQKAEQKLARTTIKAPYDGMVKTKGADVGQYVSTGSQLGVTFAIDYAEIRLPLTDKELAFINIPKVNQAALNENITSVELSANYAGKDVTWQGQIVRMEGVVDEKSRVHYAVARITDPYNVFGEASEAVPLKIGTFVTASIAGKREESLVRLPREVFKDLNNVLVSNKSNQLYERQLEVVRSEAEYSYIRSGLEDGDRIVVTSIESPVQGMELRIQGEEAQDENKDVAQEDQTESKDEGPYAQK